MKFFADEGLDYPVVLELRKNGYEVIYAAEDYAGSSDTILLQKAFGLNCIFLTKDKDFGELIFRKRLPNCGVVLVRIDRLNVLENCILVTNTIKEHISQLGNAFTVIDEHKIRIRNNL